MWLLFQPCDFVTLHLLNLCTNNVRLFVHHCPCFCYPLFLRIKKIKGEQRGLFFCATNFWRISQLVLAGAWCGEDVRRGEARLRANRDQLNKVALVYWRVLASYREHSSSLKSTRFEQANSSLCPRSQDVNWEEFNKMWGYETLSKPWSIQCLVALIFWRARKQYSLICYSWTEQAILVF